MVRHKFKNWKIVVARSVDAFGVIREIQAFWTDRGWRAVGQKEDLQDVWVTEWTYDRPQSRGLMAPA